MHIAIYKPDEVGRKILIGWEVHNTQVPGSPVPDKVGHYYSSFLSERDPMPSGTFEITESGLLPLNYTDEDATLCAAKDDKISLINRRFESITERVVPAGYLLYLYTVSLLRDVDVKPVFFWLKALNEERVKVMKTIYDADSVDDLRQISDNLGDLSTSAPTLPIFGISDDKFEFHRTATSSYSDDVTIPSGQPLVLEYTRSKVPMYAVLSTSSPVANTQVVTNHNQILVPVNPEFCFFNPDEGGPISASHLLSGWDALTPEKKKLKVVLPSLVRPSSVSLYVDSGEPITLYINSEPIYSDSQNLTAEGDVYHFKVDLDYGVTTLEFELGGNTRCGQLRVLGHEMASIPLDKTVSLSAGVLELNSSDGVGYSVVDSNSVLVHSGHCNSHLTGMEVPDGSMLTLSFSKSDGLESIWVVHTPASGQMDLYPLKVSMSPDRKSVILSHDEAESLTGKLSMVHPVPV